MQMSSTISAKRKNDAVITVKQNNDNKTVDIIGINSAASRLLGQTPENLVQKPLQVILPDELSDDLVSYVDFEFGGNDLASVLRKMRKFQLVGKDGNTIPVSLKVFYVLSDDLNPHYELLMRDTTLLERIEALRDKLMSIHKDKAAALDTKTGLANAQLLTNTLSHIVEFIKGYAIDISFALMNIDKLANLSQKYEGETESNILRAIGAIAEQTCRNEDLVGVMGNGTIGIILFDCNATDAQVVLNRLRQAVGTTQIKPYEFEEKPLINVTSSFAFAELTGNHNIQELLNSCKASLDKAEKAGGNRVVQATA